MIPSPFMPNAPHPPDPPEMTFRAVAVGLALALVFGAANAYLGMKAGQTIAATIPAAVIAIAVFRVWGGGILEQNITRTAASVGESLRRRRHFHHPRLHDGGDQQENIAGRPCERTIGNPWRFCWWAG